jgi:hypothetical protein
MGRLRPSEAVASSLQVLRSSRTAGCLADTPKPKSARERECRQPKRVIAAGDQASDRPNQALQV